MAEKLLVTGDVVLDLDIYSGKRFTPDSPEPATDISPTAGGAMLTMALLKGLAGRVSDPLSNDVPLADENLMLGIEEPTVETLRSWPKTFRSVALWQIQEATREIPEEPHEVKEKRWFPTKPVLGYGAAEAAPYPAAGGLYSR